MWTKYADETRIESADWTDLLQGDTISDSLVCTVAGDTTCTVQHLDIVGNISRFRISGGEAGQSGFIVVTITTAGGQTLTPQQPIKVVGRNTVVS